MVFHGNNNCIIDETDSCQLIAFFHNFKCFTLLYIVFTQDCVYVPARAHIHLMRVYMCTDYIYQHWFFCSATTLSHYYNYFISLWQFECQPIHIAYALRFSRKPAFLLYTTTKKTMFGICAYAYVYAPDCQWIYQWVCTLLFIISYLMQYAQTHRHLVKVLRLHFVATKRANECIFD